MAAPDSIAQRSVRAVRASLASGETLGFVRQTMRGLLNLDTIPAADLADTARRERAALDLIERVARCELGQDVAVERPAILPGIEGLEQYTSPFYAASPDGRLPGARETYRGRCNLLVTIPGASAGPGLVFNAHVDTVAPFFPFSERDGRMFGRGAADDKGQCVMLLAAMRTLAALKAAGGPAPGRDVTFQFVIEEEMGGNGSLSLAADNRYDWGCVVVCEATDMAIHPANRGATWYRVDLEVERCRGLNATLAAGRVLLELRAEGERIRAESDHPLFPDRPVQTCNGQVGGWGVHPSRVNPMIGVWVAGAQGRREAIEEAVVRGVAHYCARYGDATELPDPDDPDQPMVRRHFDLVASEGGLAVWLYGRSGHMGMIDDLDCAATKAAHVLGALEGCGAEVSLASAPPGEEQLPSADAPAALGPDASSLRRVTLAGGQGFVPTHSIGQVQGRLREAVARALASCGRGRDAARANVTFHGLHNNAFERPVDCAGMRAALEAGRLAGVYSGEAVVGFNVSCDARLFADLRPGADVITFGPGQLRHAHSDTESITADEILKGAEMLTHMALLYGRR